MHDMIETIMESKKNQLASLLQHDVSQAQTTLQHKQSLIKQKFAPKAFSQGESKFLVQLQKNTRFSERIFIIGELKFASPSAGILGSENKLLDRAKAYGEAGIDAISVITEEHFFHGKPEFVRQVKQIVACPILQKDFVIDERQIDEAKALGSDALLLIARIVSLKKLQQFVEVCLIKGIEPVVEIANEEDLDKAIQTQTHVIAVNARDLDTFIVNVARACDLLQKIPEKYVRLGFSGVKSSNEVAQYKNVGAQGILVGMSLMKAKNIKKFIHSLMTQN